MGTEAFCLEDFQTFCKRYVAQNCLGKRSEPFSKVLFQSSTLPDYPPHHPLMRQVLFSFKDEVISTVSGVTKSVF